MHADGTGSDGLLNILIADDHVLLAEAVANLLRNSAGYTVKTSATLDDTLRALAAASYDVVLLDLKMPGMVGVAGVRSVVEKAGGAKVALFTGQVDRHFLNNALEIGVKGLIPKTMPLQSLVSVIQLINSGEIFVPMNAMSNGADEGPENNAGLSPKEHFVLRLAADGLTNKEIARDMGTTEVTVKMHMRSICKKLGARNRAHAAIISRERELL